MFEDAWRLERDYFFGPTMRNVDWKAMRQKYRPLAARVTSRDELSDVLARYGEWEYARHLVTDSLSAGRIGYLHLRAMTTPDINQFVRDYNPVFNRDGLIIDVCNNNGGNIDSWVLGKLMRKAWSYWQPRPRSRRFPASPNAR